MEKTAWIDEAVALLTSPKYGYSLAEAATLAHTLHESRDGDMTPDEAVETEAYYAAQDAS